MSGHELVREIIAKHGVDRYPAAPLAVLKVMEELGELVAEILKAGADPERIRKEYADTGLALYGLGNVLGLNLETEMRAVVDGETRRFC